MADPWLLTNGPVGASGGWFVPSLGDCPLLPLKPPEDGACLSELWLLAAGCELLLEVFVVFDVVDGLVAMIS